MDALASRHSEEWWVGVFEFGARQAFQVVIVGPGLAWNETFPKYEDWPEVRSFMSYIVNSAIESLRFLRLDSPAKAKGAECPDGLTLPPRTA